MSSLTRIVRLGKNWVELRRGTHALVHTFFSPANSTACVDTVHSVSSDYIRTN